MLNTVLATVAAVVWSTAYGWFFVTDVRRWWRARHVRRAREAAEREQARLAYAAWVRNIPPPPSREPQLPPPPRPVAPPARGVVVPFPRPAASRH
jgi:hypothetical protein